MIAVEQFRRRDIREGKFIEVSTCSICREQAQKTRHLLCKGFETQFLKLREGIEEVANRCARRRVLLDKVLDLEDADKSGETEVALRQQADQRRVNVKRVELNRPEDEPLTCVPPILRDEGKALSFVPSLQE
jgi:hypothetical protein